MGLSSPRSTLPVPAKLHPCLHPSARARTRSRARWEYPDIETGPEARPSDKADPRVIASIRIANETFAGNYDWLLFGARLLCSAAGGVYCGAAIEKSAQAFAGA